MGEVTGGEQPIVKPISREGAGVRATRVLAAEDTDNRDVGIRSDFWIKGLRASNIYDDRQAAGRSFYLEAAAIDLPNDGVIELLAKIPDDLVVVAWSTAQGKGDSIFELFEDTVVSADGTPHSTFNKNRIYRSIPSRLPIFDGPTITNVGTRIIEVVIPAGQRNSAANFSSGIGDLVLLPGVNYLLRLTNISGTASTSFIATEWFEADVTELPDGVQTRAAKEIEP